MRQTQEFVFQHLTSIGWGGEKKDSKHFIISSTQKKKPLASTDSFTIRQAVAEVEVEKEKEAELGTNMAAPVGAPFLNHSPTTLFSPININKLTSMTENTFRRVSLTGTQSDV